jgi:hypothetical protein
LAIKPIGSRILVRGRAVEVSCGGGVEVGAVIAGGEVGMGGDVDGAEVAIGLG